MEELNFEKMETTQGGKFWGVRCDQSFSDDGCWEYSTNCRKHAFWIGYGKTWDNEPVYIGGPNC